MQILLLEPAFKNKYPPLSLMKIAAFHRNRGDKVFFRKGSTNDLPENILWDRIYISTLFTFAWPETCAIIDFALKQNILPENIYIGGGVATLEADTIHSYAPGIKIVAGLLNRPGLLDLPNDETIDSITPDYSILEQIDYKYAMKDAYFLYSTRGCGMSCSFCAVDRLEPQYLPYIPIVEQVQSIEHQTGPKRHLMLMDNNVLKSDQLEKIVEDICALGFQLGATYVNPGTGKTVKRTVDFNQGLDANFLTVPKAALLSRIAINPVRIAFDHIGQQEKYLKAIRTCFDSGLRSFSNYLLYNSDNASWKGITYGADDPAGLYERLQINVNLQKELQEELDKKNIKEKVSIYSFPMRYIPLDHLKRGYIGTNWNPKYLRAIQVILTPTQGKGVSSPSFFQTAFGANFEQFITALDMPERLLTRRGSPKRRAAETDESFERRELRSQRNLHLIQEWTLLYNQAKEQGLWNDFFSLFIACNRFSVTRLNESKIQHPLLKKLYLYYCLTPTRLRNDIPKLSSETQQLIAAYLALPDNGLQYLMKNWK